MVLMFRRLLPLGDINAVGWSKLLGRITVCAWPRRFLRLISDSLERAFVPEPQVACIAQHASHQRAPVLPPCRLALLDLKELAVAVGLAVAVLVRASPCAKLWVQFYPALMATSWRRIPGSSHGRVLFGLDPTSMNSGGCGY